MKPTRAAGLLACLLLAGCGSSPRDDADPVAQDVAHRTGLAVTWRRDSDADRAADAAVAGLLAQPLTADTAVQVALLDDPRLQARFAALGIAQADLVAAGLLKNPVFEGQLNLFGHGPAVEVSFLEDVLSVFSRGARKRLAAAEADAVAAETTAAVIDTAARVRAAAWTVEAAQQTLAVQRDILAAAIAADELSARIHAAGNSPALDRLRQQAMTAQARLDCAAAEETLAAARADLTARLGLWGPQAEWTSAETLAAAPAAPSADELPAPDAERQAVTQSLALAAARARIAAAAERLDLQRTWLDAALGVDAQRDAGDHEWGVGPKVAVTVPLADRGQGGRGAARDALAQSIDDYRARAIRLRARTRLAADHLRAARERALYLATVVIPLRQAITAEVQTNVNNMLDSAFALLAARADEMAAERDQVAALRDYWLARDTLKTLLAGAGQPDAEVQP
jgi:cobalt-zinc-cadmium efflux system outer membrane protein